MQNVSNDVLRSSPNVIRRQSDDKNFNALLFSPIKDVASWLNLPDRQMPNLEEVSPCSVDSDMTPCTNTKAPASPNSNIIPGTPKAVTSPKDNNFDPLRDIVNFFSPRPKQSEPIQQNDVAHIDNEVHDDLISPCNGEQAKRLDFDDLVDDAEPTESYTVPDTDTVTVPAPREVATIQDLYMDTKHGLEKVVASAKEVNIREWLEKARQLDTKDLAQKAKTSTKKTVKQLEGQVTKIVDSAKEIEPKEVFKQAKTSAKELTEKVRRNAELHPLPWAVIGVVALAIVVHVILFSGSIGTPAMRFWRFTIKVHSSAHDNASNVVERVGSFLQREMGEEAKQIFESAQSTATCAAVSGQDILRRLSHSLVEPVDIEPDLVDVVVDQIDMIRESPQQYLKFALSSFHGLVKGIWERGNQLTTDAFDEVTAL